MRRFASIVVACLLATTTGSQSAGRGEVNDPELQALQEKYLSELNLLAAEVSRHQFPYHFHLNHKLDVDEKQSRNARDNSIHFANFRGRVDLVITGNYYAAYSRHLLNEQQRAERTFREVMFPILVAAVHQFGGMSDFDGYALEISHHVLGNVLGITMEAPENVVVILPCLAAEHLIATRDLSKQQAALSEGQAFVNAEPITIQLRVSTQ